MKEYRVHHVKFYQPESKAIHSLEYEESTKKLALSRSDSTIEIWNLSSTPYQERLIIPTNDESVESLAWCRDRLFSTGLQGYILEYDLKKQTVKNREPIITGPAWCLSVSNNNSLMAVGTESGSVCLFDILPEGIKFFRMLGKQEKRVLSISWHPLDTQLVTGSLDVIQIWDLKKTHYNHRMMTGRSIKKDETIVWCVKFLRDMTVVSGDSRGMISFWNGNTGALIENIRSHNADVLSITSDKEENRLYFGSVDPIITEFSKISSHHSNATKKRKWVKSLPRNIHTHDVRALVIAGDYLVSGGVDTYLTFSKYSPKVCWKYPQMSHKQNIHVAKKARCILFQYDSHLEVWRMGQSENDSGKDGDILPLNNEPIKLLELRAKANARIISSSISETANWLSFSTADKMKLFQLSMVESSDEKPKVSLTPVISLPLECQSAQSMIFSCDEKNLFLANNNAEVQVLTLDILQPRLIHTFPSLEDSIHLMCVSNDGKYLVVGNHQSFVQVYNIKTLEIHCKIPHYKHQPTAMAINADSDKVLIAYTDHKIIEFDLVKLEYTSWSRNWKPGCVVKTAQNIIKNISFDRKDPDILIMHTDSSVISIDRNAINENAKERKFRKKGSENRDTSAATDDNITQKMTKRYKHLLHFGDMDGNEMIAVELPPSFVFDNLPSALKQKKFGT